MRERFLRAFWCVLLIACIGFIWSNSATPAAVSGEQSGYVLEFLSSFVPFNLTDHIVRKLAHFCEFALEGFVLLQLYAVGRGRPGLKALLFTVPFGFLTAGTDEIIQLFYEGRSCQLSDCLLDTAGCLCGVLCGLCVLWIFQLAFRGKSE